MPNCRRLFRQYVSRALAFDFPSTGSSRAATTHMMAITISISNTVKPPVDRLRMQTDLVIAQLLSPLRHDAPPCAGSAQPVPRESNP